MRLVLFLFCGLASAGSLPAQSASLTGPVEALTFDAPTRSIRAVMGSPGAATFGPALLENLDLASVAPGQNYGILFEQGKCVSVSGLGSKIVSTTTIAGITTYPDGIVWSANGSLAILYSRAEGWFQTVSGWPGAPIAGRLMEVSSLGGSLAAIAADAPGKQIAFALGGQKGAIYQASGQEFTPLISMTKPLALSFSNDGGTLYALDGANLDVAAVSLGGHGFQTLALPGMTNPVAVQAFEDSQNRQLLFVAGGSDRVLRILDVASQQIVQDVTLYFQPTSLQQFGSASFAVAARAQVASPLWLFATTPVPAAYFVPAIQSHRPGRASEIVRGAR